MLYQYFSHHLQTFLHANIVQRVKIVVTNQESQLGIHLSARIGSNKTAKNFAWWDKQRYIKYNFKSLFQKTSLTAEIHVSIFNFIDSFNDLSFSLTFETSVSCDVNITRINADIASNIANIVYQLSGCHFKINEARSGVKIAAKSS